MRINFKDPNDAYRFFDMFSNQRCRREHFVYCCMFLAKGLDFMELLELFNILDTKKDGTLDEYGKDPHLNLLGDSNLM